MADPSAKPGPRRIPGLDGLRAISILMVLTSHFEVTREGAKLTALRRLGELGNLGVRVFFVISGYLITTLLLAELQKTERIDLEGFYVRRAYRIFPAFYVFLGVVAALGLAGVLAVGLRDVGLAATYLINFIPERSWYVGHGWSLAVEEQFYLLWPLALSLSRKSKGLWVAIAVVAIAPVVRLAMWFLMPAAHPLIGEAFPTVADSIACGCILAILGPKLAASPRYLALLRSPAFVIVPVVAFAANLTWTHAKIFFGVGTTVLNVAIALIVDRCVRDEGWLRKILEVRVLVWVGGLSYSLYLWQQLFLTPESVASNVPFPLNVAAAFACATASFYLIEQPILRMRTRRA